MKCVIFDLDGTLADMRHRLHYIKNGNRDWDKFYDNCDKDTVIEEIKLINRSLYNESIKIVIMTGRDEIVRNKTIKWLYDNAIVFDELWMRDHGNHEPDYKLKRKWADKIGVKNIICVFEDRDRVVQMWRELGITCLQVSNGKY